MALRIVTASANIPRDNHWIIPSGSTTPVRTLLLESGRNQPAYSNDFSNAVYTKEGSTVTGSIAGITAPDGTETAWILRETTANSVHGLVRESSQGSNSNWGLGVFVKVFNTRTHARLYVYGDSGTAGFVTFNLSGSGSFTITQPSAGAINYARMQDYGNGWWRLSAFWRMPAFGTQQGYLRVCQSDSVVSYAGNTTEGLYVWGWNDQSTSGPFNDLIGSPNAAVTSYISSSATAAYRYTDNMSFLGQTGTPQELTIYVKGIPLSFANLGYIILLGDNQLPNAKAGIRRTTTGFAQAVFDAEGSADEVGSTAGDTSLLTPGNQVELMMHMSSSKQIQLFHTKNGGAVETSSLSPVSPGTFPPAWWGAVETQNNLFLAQGTDSAPGISFAYEKVLIVRGKRTMEEMRTFTGIS